MFWQTVVTASLLAGAQAGIVSLMAEGISRNSPSLERRMQEIARAETEARAWLESRQVTGTTNATTTTATGTSITGIGPGVVLNADGTINMTAWDATVTAACTTALNQLTAASNPSGTCVCYNLPALDNTTGAFEADLRLYSLSAATGEFAGISGQNIQVSLRYNGASVSPVSASTAAGSVKVTGRAIEKLTLLQTYLFVGQIDKTQMTGPMTEAKLEAFVMPTVTLSGVNAAGNTVSTNLSTNEAAFVAGVFSDAVIMSNLTLAQLAVDQKVAGLANGTVAFVLPGVNILIMPIGLVVTSTWLLIGLFFYGWGTIERVNYAESFKSREMRARKATTARI